MLLCLFLFVSLIGHAQCNRCESSGGDRINTTNITSQSSVYIDNTRGPFSSGLAVDGQNDTCAHGLQQQNSWWRIDLLGVYTVSSICILTSDYVTNGSQIHIGNSLKNNGTDNKRCTEDPQFENQKWNYIKCTNNVSGRYITVFLRRIENLVLCEVRIYGTKKASPFELISQKKTWEEALNYCRDRNWDLASILNEEDQVLAEVEAGKANSPFVWLGLHHTCVLDAWFWVANHRLEFARWGPGGLKRECDMSATMERVKDHQWYSKSDYEKFNFICQK